MIDVFTAITLLTALGVFALLVQQGMKEKRIQEHYLAFHDVATRHKRLRQERQPGTESFKFLDNLVRQEMARTINRAIPKGA